MFTTALPCVLYLGTNPPFPSCPHSSPHAHSLPSASLLTLTLTQLLHALVFFSVTVYTIVASSLLHYSFLSFFFVFCFFLTLHFPLLLFPSISPSPRLSPISFIPPFQLHFSFLFFILVSLPHLFLIQHFPFHYHSSPSPFIYLSS